MKAFDEYEDDVASVPAPPAAPAAASTGQAITLDRRLMPAGAAVLLIVGGLGLYVVQSTRSSMAQSTASTAPVKMPTDDGMSLQLPAAPSPSTSPLPASPLPTLRPTPTPAPSPSPARDEAPAAAPAEPRTPSPEEAYAEEERRRLLEMRRAPSRVAALDASSSLASDAQRDAASLARPQLASTQGAVSGYLPTTSRCEIRRGTRFTTRWVTALDSSLAGGVVVVQVAKTVKDSITGLLPVFPAGTLLTGVMSSSPIAGQARYGIGLDEAELPAPDSRKFYMGEQPGAGRLGESGADVTVDTHAGRQFWNSAIYATIQAGLNLATRASSTVVNLNGSNMGLQPAQQLAPTFHAKPGDELTVTVSRDLPTDCFEGKLPQ